jgi:uncharacterized protein
MTDATEPIRNEAGNPYPQDAPGPHQAVQIDEGFNFSVVNDEKTGIYEAVAGDTKIAGLPYNVAGGDRLVLLATSVFPAYRNHGVATELIRRVLDDVRAHGKTVTIMCPIVRSFIDHHPDYADLIDPKHPGLATA